MTDSVIDQMNITNASCVMHYSPADKKTFCKRLTTLAGTFASSEVLIMIISMGLVHQEAYAYVYVHFWHCRLNQFFLYGKN